MKLFQRITLALMGCMLLSTPAMAADYSFETKAPADYYGSTAYEEVYGAQYNYGGQNAVDFLDPLADSAPSPLAGNTIEYGIGSSSGSIYPDGTSNDYPLQWGGPSVTPVTAFTPVSDVEQANGSIVKPTVTVQASASLANGYQVVNRVDAGGQYMSQWETGRAAWITLIVRLNEPTLPKTGY